MLFGLLRDARGLCAKGASDDAREIDLTREISCDGLLARLPQGVHICLADLKRRESLKGRG